MTTPTTELIERLRSYQAYCPQTDRSDHPICAEAASCITELQDEVVRLREALTAIGHSLVCAPIDYAEHNAGELLRAGNIARAALDPQPPAKKQAKP